jgi:hypothetical protein
VTQSILFSTYLNDRMTARRMVEAELVHELGYKMPITVRRWLEGRGRPMIEELSTLATVLHADPVDVALGWVIDQCPELETVLRAEVLDPRGSKFPQSTDLSLRLPKPVKWDPAWQLPGSGSPHRLHEMECPRCDRSGHLPTKSYSTNNRWPNRSG